MIREQLLAQRCSIFSVQGIFRFYVLFGGEGGAGLVCIRLNIIVTLSTKYSVFMFCLGEAWWEGLGWFA